MRHELGGYILKDLALLFILVALRREQSRTEHNSAAPIQPGQRCDRNTTHKPDPLRNVIRDLPDVRIADDDVMQSPRISDEQMIVLVDVGSVTA